MSDLRVFWIIWCSMWAAFWMLMGFVTLGIAWLLVPAALLAIFMPVGQAPRPPRAQLPPGGWPAMPPPPPVPWDRR